MIQTINPASGAAMSEFTPQTSGQVDVRIARAVEQQRVWKSRAVSEREDLLKALAEHLRQNARSLAEIITREMGKPITEAVAEVEKCAWCCDHYARNATVMLETQIIASSAPESGIVFDPLGVILAIMPWNYPLWQFFRFAAPALVAGNAVVLKHANNVPECALAIEQIFTDIGCPEGLVTTLLIETGLVSTLLEDDRIAAVTFTGSTEVGAIIATQAARQIKKQVLELGGSDPFIVLADADLEKAVAAGIKARFINVGQSCVNAKRFILEDAIADQFVEQFTKAAQALIIDDPMKPETQIGPMARANLRDTLHAQVVGSIERGAILRTGGAPVDRPGYYYAPTVLDHVGPGMPAFEEELFGPVAAMLRVPDRNAAIAMANDSEYGLGAALWTSDMDFARQAMHDIEAGAVFINSIVASDPRLPFGGIKKSGYGRELGVHGLMEFVNVKTFSIGAV